MYVDTTAKICLPIKSFIIINLSLTHSISKILSIQFLATSNLTPPRANLFPTQNILYLLSFSVISQADAPLHPIFCTHHILTFLLVIVSTTSLAYPLIVPIFRLPNLNFSSVYVVPNCRLIIWEYLWLASTLLYAGPLSMTPALLTQLWLILNWTISSIGASFTAVCPY